MIQVTPQQFKDAFLHTVAPLQSEVVQLWNQRRAYTSMMLQRVCPAIATQLGLEVYNADYYYLDSVFYAERDLEHFPETTYYARCLSIAFEHEHDITGTATEMNKLQLFNASLKVLVTYGDSPVHFETYLKRYVKIIQWADIFGDFATLRRQLVVFGRLHQGVATWFFYAYTSSGFELL